MNDTDMIKIQKFMNMVMEEIRRDSLKNLMDVYGMNLGTDFEVIEEWFCVHGIKI